MDVSAILLETLVDLMADHHGVINSAVACIELIEVPLTEPKAVAKIFDHALAILLSRDVNRNSAAYQCLNTFASEYMGRLEQYARLKYKNPIHPVTDISIFNSTFAECINTPNLSTDEIECRLKSLRANHGYIVSRLRGSSCADAETA